MRYGRDREDFPDLQGLYPLGLLLNVVIVAILSMPTPVQQITPDNVWVGHFPFISLPAIRVTAAMLGHLVLFRKLALEKKQAVPAM